MLLLTAGCKPQQIIKERTITVKDSTEVINLTHQLHEKTIEVAILKADISRIKEENTKLQSELTTHVINYDTTAVLNPDGKYPISQEIIHTSKHKLEQQLQENETIIAEYKKEVDNLMHENSNLKHQLQAKQETEDQTDTIIPKQRNRLKYLLYAATLFLVLYIDRRLKL